MTAGKDRLHYAQQAVGMVRGLVAAGRFEEARQLRSELPLGTNLMLWNDDAEGAAKLEELPELANALAFDVEELGVMLRDGRIRDDGAMTYLPSGSSTPDLLRLLALLHRGIERDALLARAAELDVGFDDELLDDLIARGVVEHGEPPVPAPVTAPAIEWLGHAYVRAICPTATLWFDPFTSPRVTWTDPEEREAMFSADVPDTFLLDNYGPDAHQITQDELAIPSAIFVTHQDTDHIDLGAVALVPPEVPIFVPATDGAPWQVDLVQAIRAILGEDRDVRVLRHGESVVYGDLKVTAFPFVGEFPISLQHHWNGYLVELPDQVWALCADSAVTELHVDWLRERLAGDLRPFGIMVNGVIEHRYTPGYRDAIGELTTFNRLYSWYLPPARLFEPCPACGLPTEILKRLVDEVHLSYVYFYAHGNLPWYRMTSTVLHHSHVGSHTRQAFETMSNQVVRAGARVLRLKHGVPHVGAAVSAFPRR